MYNCPICNNEQWIIYTDKDGYECVKPCQCQKIRRSLKLAEESGLGNLLSIYTFDNYKTDLEWQKALKNNALQYVKEPNNKWFIALGTSGCVDCDTEYFDGTQWKRIADYNGEKVLQYNPKTQEATLTNPIRYIKEKEEFLYQISTYRGSVNMCLSADHNFAYITSKGHMAKKRFSEVMEMHNNNKHGFCGYIETAFKYNGKGIDLTDEEIRIMVAVMADGYFKPKNKKCTIRVKKERKKERLRKLLKNIGFKEYFCKDNFSQFCFYAPRREKEFTDYWFNCNHEQLLIIKDEVFNWDGSIDNKGRKFYFSTSKKSADFIQFVMSATGSRSTIMQDIRISGIHKKICYTVNEIKGSSKITLNCSVDKMKAKIDKVKSIDGYKYCFTVETGYLVLRRGDRIFITGNCGKSHLCTAICKELLNKGKEVIFMSWLEESGKLKRHITDNDYDNLIDRYKNAEVLYIDDFWKNENSTEPTSADIKLANEILNYRYNKARATNSLCKTIISSERPMAQIIDFDSAIAGRLVEMSKGYLNEIKGAEKNYRLKEYL